MKPVLQTQFEHPTGNCFAACIASILELPLDAIPSPRAELIEADGSWSLAYWEALAGAVKDRGFYLLDLDREKGCASPWSSASIAEPERHEYWIANGPGPRGLRHSVVMLGPDLAHDPHPDALGLVDVDGSTRLVPYDPAERLESERDATGERCGELEARAEPAERVERAAREILVHWCRVRASKLTAEEARENLRCAADLAEEFGWQAELFWRDPSESLPHRAEHHNSAALRVEPAELPEGMKVAIIKALDRPSLFSRRQDAQAAIAAALAALALYRFESAAEELRLRRALEDIERTDRAALAELKKMGINLDDDCEGMKLRRKVAAALATQPSRDAEALAKLAALPKEWEAAEECGPVATVELRTVLDRLGLVPEEG